MRITKKTILFTLLFFISLVPRGIELLSSSNYFGSEQGMEYLITKEIFVDYKIVLVAPQGSFGDILKPAGFNYLLGIPFVIASGNPFGGRIFMFAISMLTIMVAIVLTRRMFGYTTSFFICFFLAISSNLSHLAGRIYTPAFIPILIILLLFAIFKAIKGDSRFIFFSAFTIGLTSHFEMATAGKLGVMFFIVLIYLAITNRISTRHVLMSFLVFLIPLMPMIVYDLSHNFQNINGILKMFSAGIDHTAEFSSSKFMIIIMNRIDVFRWNFISTFSPHFIIWTIILTWIIVGSYIYINKTKKYSPQKIVAISLFILPIASFFLLIFYPGNIVQWWLLELVIGYCFLLGIIFGVFWRKKYARSLIILTLIILFASFFNRTYTLYTREFTYPLSLDLYVREIGPIRFIFEDAQGRPIDLKIFSRNSKSNYEYLLWWYRKKNYPQSVFGKDEKITYSLVEQESINSLAYKKYVNNNNKILLNTKLFGGFIVQKWENK